MVKNPVMFVTEVGAALTTSRCSFGPRTSRSGSSCRSPSGSGSRCCSPTSPRPWPKAEARPRPTRCERHAPGPWRIAARRRLGIENIPADQLRKGDIVAVSAGEIIPADGEVIEGAATVDESAITGESAPVIREAGGDRSAVTGGTRVLSDRMVIRSPPTRARVSWTA